MPNMSYCRFRNTLPDLRDCAEHMDDDFRDELSSEDQEGEEKARERLVKLCVRIAEDYGPYYGLDVTVEKEE